MNFKIGDTVECLCKTSTNYHSRGVVKYVGCESIRVQYPCGEIGHGKFKYYKLITAGKSNNPVAKIMNSAINIVKNMALSADEKLLRKVEFKNDCGDYTEKAKELVLLKLVADNNDYLLGIAKEIKAEQDEEKCTGCK